MSLPRVASREEWLAARKELLADEKAMTRARDKLNTKRRELPMVRIDKEYVFEGRNGKATLLDLFEDRRQLVVVHFMFDPSWDDGCPSCTAGADEVSAGSDRPSPHSRHHAGVRVTGAHRQDRALQGQAGLDVSLVLVVRERLQLRLPRHARRIGRSDRVQLPHEGGARRTGRGLSRAASRSRCPDAATSCATATAIFHTYSVYARGLESIGGSYYLLDETALGRQEAWEEPKGRAADARGCRARLRDLSARADRAL